MKIVSLGEACLDALSLEDSAGARGRDRFFDRLVHAAQHAPRPEGYSQEYDLLRPYFDPAFYFTANPSVARARLDPLAHYMRAGDREGRDPTPWFSCSTYKARCPEAAESGLTALGHWITAGQAAGIVASPVAFHDEVAQMLGLSPGEAWDISRNKLGDIGQRLTSGALAEQVAQAAELEPLIASSLPQAAQLVITPFTSASVMQRIAALHDLQAQALFRPARSVILADGESDRIAGFPALGLASAETRRHGADQVVLMLSGARPSSELVALPEGMRIVSVDKAMSICNAQGAQRSLAEFIRSLAPETLILGQSGPGGGALMEAYGRQLAAAMRIVMCLDADAHAGFPYAQADQVAHFVTASEAQRQAVIRLAGVPQARLSCLPGCVARPARPARAPRDALVAGIASAHAGEEGDLFLATALACPDLQFRLLLPDAARRNRPLRFFPDNVEVCEAGDAEMRAALDDAAVWLDLGGEGEMTGVVLFAALSGVPVATRRQPPHDVSHVFTTARQGVAGLVDLVKDAAARSSRAGATELASLQDLLEAESDGVARAWSGAPETRPGP